MSPSTRHDCSNFHAYQQRSYFPELDGLRAVCILLVITVHLYSHKEWWEWLAGHRGVSIFFVVSGYLITTLALREEKERGRLALGSFLIRRAFRLFPLYYLILGVYVGYVLLLGQGSLEQRFALREALPWYALYCQEWPFYQLLVVQQRDLPFFQTWSLGIEEKFYLLWPVLAFGLWRARPRWRLGGTVVLVLLFGLSALLTPLGPTGNLVARYLSGYYAILVGCLLALLLHDRTSFERMTWLCGRAGGWPTLILLALAHFLTPWVTGWPLLAVNAFYPLATAGVLVGLIEGTGPLAGLLRTAGVVFVGRLSYGVYLVHLLATALVYRLLPIAQFPAVGSVVAVALISLTSIGIAYVLHRLVERPGIWMGRMLSRWRMALPAVAATRPGAGTEGRTETANNVAALTLAANAIDRVEQESGELQAARG